MRTLIAHLVLAFALALAPSSASASEWKDYRQLFPSFPCHDGWVGCMANGRHLTPEPMRGKGRAPIRADARIDFLALTPTAAFDPFVKLSDYPLEPAKVAVLAVPEPPPVKPLPVEEPVRPIGYDAKTESPPIKTEPAPPLEVDHDDEPVAKVEPIPKVEPVAKVEEPEGTQPLVPPTDRPAGEEAGHVPSEPTDDDDAVAIATIAADGCDDLRALEPAAMLGRLSVDQRACLDASMDASTLQTRKKAISLMRIQDAWTRDKNDWGVLVKQHLSTIDQSDPNLCSKYAQYLRKRGQHASTIHWAEVALENKTRWSGETYTSRVYDLYKLRAASQQSIWMAAEAAYAKAPSKEVDATRTEARSKTKVFAREWLDYARTASKDTTKALAVCTSAAGNSEYCE